MRAPLDHNFVMFRSPRTTQVAWTLYADQREFTLAELRRVTGIPAPTLSRMLDDLTRGGVTLERRVGRARVVRANSDAPFYRPLRDLLEIICGPPATLAVAFAEVEGIEEIFLFGSWAARAMGEPGWLPRDIDVLVVGDAHRDDVREACVQAQEALHRDVNPIIASRGQVTSAQGLLRSILDGPLVRVPHAPKPVTRTEEDRARARLARLAEIDDLIESLEAGASS